MAHRPRRGQSRWGRTPRSSGPSRSWWQAPPAERCAAPHGWWDEAAIRSGLWAVQRDDYPVTVQTGHSLAQLVLSPEALPVITVAAPDVLVLLTDDGLRKSTSLLRAMQTDGVVVTVPEFADVETPARVVVVDPASAPTRVGKADLALVLLAAAVARLDLLPLDALREAAGAGVVRGCQPRGRRDRHRPR